MSVDQDGQMRKVNETLKLLSEDKKNIMISDRNFGSLILSRLVDSIGIYVKKILA